LVHNSESLEQMMIRLLGGKLTLGLILVLILHMMMNLNLLLKELQLIELFDSLL
jgi:hypothetical protein